MAQLLLFNKPYQVLSQFTDQQGRTTLADFITMTGMYPAGRLDYDSEGLLLLTDNGALQARIAQPHHKMVKCYRVQVDGDIDDTALHKLTEGMVLKDGPARALRAQRLATPTLWPRDPPIRQRRHQPTSWLEIDIDEGRNRQVRRMTAAVGFPTLRLVRWRIGPWAVTDLAPGQAQLLTVHVDNARARHSNKPAPQRHTPQRPTSTARRRTKKRS